MAAPSPVRDDGGRTGADARVRRRVVVTGAGAITPFGDTVDALWENLVSGRSAVKPIARFDASTFPTTFAAEATFTPTWSPDDPPICRSFDRKDVYGWFAARDALEDAGIALTEPDRRVGVVLGTERRPFDLLSRVASRTTLDGPTDHLRTTPFALGGTIAAARCCAGPNLAVAAACASSTQAIGVAYRKVQWSEADVMLAGGCDSLIDPMMLTAFSRLGALSTRNDDPAHASRPFDLHRDGFVLGEGAGMVVLEARDRALARGAHIYGEIIGFGASTSAYRLTDSEPDGHGEFLAMHWALTDAGLPSEAVDYINAHGTSTQQNDRCETRAIKRCFGPRARHLPVSSTKSMLGHLVCAGGAVELIVCLRTIATGVITPTINYQVPDPECDLDYVPNHARTGSVTIALSNSCGFGGVNASILVARHDSR